jgi:hypothetical protein
LGEYPVANSLFIENKIPKKEIKIFCPKIMTICLQQEGCLRGGEKEKKSP